MRGTITISVPEKVRLELDRVSKAEGVSRSDIVLSTFILDEFREKLVNKFGFTTREANRAVRLPASRCRTATPSKLPRSICRDPDDDEIIGTAVAGSCDCIVTGDKDLLDLKETAGIVVIPSSQFWEFENKQVESHPIARSARRVTHHVVTQPASR